MQLDQAVPRPGGGEKADRCGRSRRNRNGMRIGFRLRPELRIGDAEKLRPRSEPLFQPTNGGRLRRPGRTVCAGSLSVQIAHHQHARAGFHPRNLFAENLQDQLAPIGCQALLPSSTPADDEQQYHATAKRRGYSGCGPVQGK